MSKIYEDVSTETEYDLTKRRFCRQKIVILDLILKNPKIFKCQVLLLFFVLNDRKLSSHMTQISEHITSSNNKIHSYDETKQIIFSLGNKIFENNDNSSLQLTSLQDSLLMSIIDTPEWDLSKVDGKSFMRKVRTYEVKSSSTLFSCLIRAMYNTVNRAKKSLTLKS